MTIEFTLPELGENITSGDVVNVLVSEGDTIAQDDPVLEIETDKATIEVPSSIAGEITTIHIKEGDTVEVGQVILTAEEEAGVAPEESEPPAEETAQAKEPSPAEAETPPEPEPEPVPAEESAPAEPQIVEFKLPDLGENIEAGEVVSVLVAAGDEVEKDQPVLELETDKATVEVPSLVSGVIKEVHIREGETASVGQLILTIETTTPAAKEVAPATEPEAEPEPAPEPPPAKPTPVRPGAPLPAIRPQKLDISPRPRLSMVPAAPNVRRFARELGVDITAVEGTGPKARISMDDVKRHAQEMMRAVQEGAAPAPAAPAAAPPPLPDFTKWGDVERKSMSNIRRATARQMETAWTTVPHVTQFDKADITDLEQLRKRFGKKVEDMGGKLTITAILLKVAAAALKEFPQFKASVDMSNEEVIYKNYCHIGVAVDTDRGLLVPVIRDVDQKNIMELAVELGEVAQKARDKKLGLDDMRGGVFTITNLGGIGGTNFTPIVNSPEVAILGIARGGKEPVFKNGQFEPRLMLPLSLSYDHRLIDGADGARFLRFIVEYLEQPFLTALQGW